jgi:hypothetical protein
MDSIVTALQGAFTGPGALGNILKTGVTAAGGIGDIISQQKQNSSLNQVLQYQKNPALAAQKIAQMTQPLSQGLTQDVGNNVQGYLGERGLSGSPNITASVLAQALAPYQQQNQQLATSQFGQLLNPAGAGFGKPIDWGSLMKLWMPAPKLNPAGTNPASTGPFPNMNTAGTSGTLNSTPPFFPTTGPSLSQAAQPPDMSGMDVFSGLDSYPGGQ